MNVKRELSSALISRSDILSSHALEIYRAMLSQWHMKGPEAAKARDRWIPPKKPFTTWRRQSPVAMWASQAGQPDANTHRGAGGSQPKLGDVAIVVEA